MKCLTCMFHMMANDSGQQKIKCHVRLPLWPDVRLFYQCKCYLHHANIRIYGLHYIVGACGQVDRALDSRSQGLGFDSQCWPCVEVSGKLCIPHCLGPPSRNGYLVHRSKVGSIVAVGAHCQGEGKV